MLILTLAKKTRDGAKVNLPGAGLGGGSLHKEVEDNVGESGNVKVTSAVNADRTGEVE